ncbi:hypothetical protein EDB87DRAFT_1818892 [Lactarius vividus]|nr:hypothetical protein EDB87DRAFT_1818892 [Lactarius vividus]
MSPYNSLRSGPDPNSQDPQSDITRRPYVRPELKLNIAPTPKHWVLTSKEDDLDINEEDGYVLSANGDGSRSGVFVPCDALSGISNARPGRLRAKPQILHRRRVSGIAVSPTLSDTSSLTTPFSGSRIRHLLPPTPSTPDTDFRKLCNSVRLLDASPITTRSKPLDTPAVSLSRTPSTPRQLRPVLYVKTSSPVGTSPPPPTPALPSPQFRPSGRLPKRPPIPVWAPEHYPRAVAV